MVDLANQFSQIFGYRVVINAIILFSLIGVFNSVKIFNHDRYIKRKILLIILILLISNYYLHGFMEAYEKVSIIILMLILVYAILAYLFSKNLPFYSKYKIQKIRKLISEGEIWEVDTISKKTPWYMISIKESFDYKMIIAKYFDSKYQYGTVYKIYESVDQEKLFNKEKQKLLVNKGFTLLQLGAINQVKEVVSDFPNKNCPEYFMIKGVIEEKSLNIEKASQITQKALSILKECETDSLKAMTYNNIARLRLMENNITDALYFYEQAAAKAITTGESSLINIIYPNIISICVKYKKIAEADKYLDKYEKNLDLNTAENFTQILNLKLDLYRQGYSKINFITLMKEKKKLEEKLHEKEKLILNINTLRALNNEILGNLGLYKGIKYPKTLENLAKEFHNLVLNISGNIEKYLTLDIESRYYAFKEIYQSLNETTIPELSNCFKVKLPYFKAKEYIKNQAILDIEKELKNTAPYEVHKRCKLSNEKIILFKIHNSNFDDIYKQMIELNEILINNGLIDEALMQELDIIDECLSPEYFIKDYTLPEYIKTKMNHHINKVITRIKTLRNIPQLSEINLRLAFYLFRINRISESKEYLNRFENGPMSIKHYANWVNKYHNILEKKYNNYNSWVSFDTKKID